MFGLYMFYDDFVNLLVWMLVGVVLRFIMVLTN